MTDTGNGKSKDATEDGNNKNRAGGTTPERTDGTSATLGLKVARLMFVVMYLRLLTVNCDYYVDAGNACIAALALVGLTIVQVMLWLAIGLYLCLFPFRRVHRVAMAMFHVIIPRGALGHLLERMETDRGTGQTGDATEKRQSPDGPGDVFKE